MLDSGRSSLLPLDKLFCQLRETNIGQNEKGKHEPKPERKRNMKRERKRERKRKTKTGTTPKTHGSESENERQEQRETNGKEVLDTQASCTWDLEIIYTATKIYQVGKREYMHIACTRAANMPRTFLTKKNPSQLRRERKREREKERERDKEHHMMPQGSSQGSSIESRQVKPKSRG